MRADCSFKYFRQTLQNGLNYFCQRQTAKNERDASTVIAVHNSYNSFIEILLKTIGHNMSMTQDDVRQCYKRTFDTIKRPLPQPILKLGENNRLQLFHDNDEDDENEVNPVVDLGTCLLELKTNRKEHDSHHEATTRLAIQIYSNG